MPDLVQMMQSWFRRLLLDFELTYSAGQITHSAERGRLLEETLRKFLSIVLPKRIGIGSGQIVAALEQEPSKQVDIVLYDGFNYPLLLSEGSFQLFPNEAVLVAIEVKSKLAKRYLKEGIDNLASCKSLGKFPVGKHCPTLTVLFSYKTVWKRPSTLFRNIHEATNGELKKAPDLVCSLDPGFLLAATATLGKSVSRMGAIVSGTERESTYPLSTFAWIRPLAPSNREHVLLWFYLLLVDYLNRTLNIGVNMAQYMKSPTAWRVDTLDWNETLGQKRT